MINVNRISMHSVREELLDEQAKKIGLLLYKIRIPFPCTNKIYEEMMKSFLKKGYGAILTCIDEKKLTPEFSGVNYDLELLASFPKDIDPCGENGEFYTFVYDCPLFSEGIQISTGERISRDGFTFTDINLKY